MINLKIESGEIKEVGKAVGAGSIPFGAIIQQEWLQRTVFVAILAWSSVSITRAVWFGLSRKKITPKKTQKIRMVTEQLFYLYAFLWSVIFIFSFCAKAVEGRELTLNIIYFCMYYCIVVVLKNLWAKGIAPYMDKKIGTNFIPKRGG